MTVRIFNKTKYDRLTNVLKNWYSEEQVNEIWGLLKDYDNQLWQSMSQTKITEDNDE
jgi:5-methylthioribose kinase